MIYRRGFAPSFGVVPDATLLPVRVVRLRVGRFRDKTSEGGRKLSHPTNHLPPIATRSACLRTAASGLTVAVCGFFSYLNVRYGKSIYRTYCPPHCSSHVFSRHRTFHSITTIPRIDGATGTTPNDGAEPLHNPIPTLHKNRDRPHCVYGKYYRCCSFGSKVHNGGRHLIYGNIPVI